MEEDLIGFGISIGICVIMPIAIVWIVFNAISNKNNKQAEILLEAIKRNPDIDSQKLIDALNKREFSPRESLTRKLLRGAIFTMLGIAFALISIFMPTEGVFGLWIACGVCGAVGIGFLLTFWFNFYTIKNSKAVEKKL